MPKRLRHSTRSSWNWQQRQSQRISSSANHLWQRKGRSILPFQIPIHKRIGLLVRRNWQKASKPSPPSTGIQWKHCQRGTSRRSTRRRLYPKCLLWADRITCRIMHPPPRRYPIKGIYNLPGKCLNRLRWRPSSMSVWRRSPTRTKSSKGWWTFSSAPKWKRIL